MSSQGAITHDDYAKRYEVMLRISEALSACREPADVATTLANELEKLFRFDHLWIAVLKDNSQEIEYRVWGKGAVALPDLPFDELAGWEAMKSQSAVQIVDWEKEKRFSRFKEWAIRTGVGSTVSVPLTTAQRRLGVFRINRDSVSRYSEEDISLLRLIGRVVAFALDDGLNLRRARRQSDRLQLLLNLTSRITSNLELQQLLRAVAANRLSTFGCSRTSILPAAISCSSRLALRY
jgi:GAF domain-containing protein